MHCFYVNAQGSKKKSTTPIFSQSAISLQTYMQQDNQIEDLEICEIGSLFIRFKIDKSGNVVDLHFSNNTLAPIKEILKKRLLSTNGKWTASVINKKNVLSDYILLPVFINLMSCNERNYIVDSSVYPVLNNSDSLKMSINAAKPKNLATYLSIRQFKQARDLLLFDDGKYLDGFNCQILSGVTFFSVR